MPATLRNIFRFRGSDCPFLQAKPLRKDAPALQTEDLAEVGSICACDGSPKCEGRRREHRHRVSSIFKATHDISVEEGEDPPEDGEEPAEEIGGTFEYADNFREMMMYSAEDKKADTFVPIAGNTYRFWGLGIPEHRFTTQNFGVLSILLVQDWEGWHFGLSDWYYIPSSDEHGVSNLSKHVVATAFLIMFTLNGAMVVDNERIASLKISALLDAPAIKNKPGFLKDVNLFWLNVGRVLNCVVECCVIVYFAFVLSENPMDVVFNALAVTFLYNLDDIGGETGFLTEDDWDGDELGKIYYHAVDAVMTENQVLNPDGYTPDEINSCNEMRDKYGHLPAWKQQAKAHYSQVQAAQAEREPASKERSCSEVPCVCAMPALQVLLWDWLMLIALWAVTQRGTVECSSMGIRETDGAVAERGGGVEERRWPLRERGVRGEILCVATDVAMLESLSGQGKLGEVLESRGVYNQPPSLLCMCSSRCFLC
eukprot:s3444_g3.t1